MDTRTVVRRKAVNASPRAIGVFFLIGLSAMTTRPGLTGSKALSGKMVWWQHMVGSWRCALTVEEVEGQPARQINVPAVGSVAPDNVFHWALTSAELHLDQYVGYDEHKKAWWETRADSFG